MNFKRLLDNLTGHARSAQKHEMDARAERHDEGPHADQALERRYVEQMNMLLEDANQRGALSVFTDVLKWKLAVLAYGCGPAAAGDILARLGGHLCTLADIDKAQREAEEARKSGRLPS
jgi:hypothetical protein